MLSNNDDQTDQDSTSSTSVPVVAKEEDEEIDTNGNKSWLIIVIILLIIFIVLIFIILVLYKERRSTMESTPRFSPKAKGGESQYALKDCMEGEEDVTFIGTGQNGKTNQFDNSNNVEKEKSLSSSSSSSESSFSSLKDIPMLTPPIATEEEDLATEGRNKPVQCENNQSSSAPTDVHLPKSNSLFDCNCGTKDSSSSHPCFQ